MEDSGSRSRVVGIGPVVRGGGEGVWSISFKYRRRRWACVSPKRRAGSDKARSLEVSSVGEMERVASEAVVVGEGGWEGREGRPRRFRRARSLRDSSSSRRRRDSSARRRRFSSRAAVRAASSSSSLRFWRSLASRELWRAACSER